MGKPSSFALATASRMAFFCSFPCASASSFAARAERFDSRFSCLRNSGSFRRLWSKYTAYAARPVTMVPTLMATMVAGLSDDDDDILGWACWGRGGCGLGGCAGDGRAFRGVWIASRSAAGEE